jgi:hypothetical protein
MVSYMSDNKELLFAAVQNSNVKAVEALLKQDINLVNSTDKDGYTPLHFVQDKEIARILLQNGADPIKEATKDGTTPAFWAQQLADKSIAQMISNTAKAATKETEIVYEKLPPASLHNEILTALQNNDVGKLKSSLDKMSAQDMKELLNTPDNIGKKPIDYAKSRDTVGSLIAAGSDAKVTFKTKDGPIDITYRFMDALFADNKSNPSALKDKNVVQTKCFIMGKIAHHIVDVATGQPKPNALEAAAKAEKFRKDNPKLNISDNDIKRVLEVLKVERMIETTTKQEKPVAINALKKDNKIKPTFLERVAKKLHISSKGSSR